MVDIHAGVSSSSVQQQGSWREKRVAAGSAAAGADMGRGCACTCGCGGCGRGLSRDRWSIQPRRLTMACQKAPYLLSQRPNLGSWWVSALPACSIDCASFLDLNDQERRFSCNVSPLRQTTLSNDTLQIHFQIHDVFESESECEFSFVTDSYNL